METKYASESDLERMQAKWAKGRKPNADDLQWCLANNIKESANIIARQTMAGERGMLKMLVKEAKQRALRMEFDRTHKPFKAAGTDFMWFVEVP